MKKIVLILLSVLIVSFLIVSIFISYKHNNEYLKVKGDISHSKHLEVINFNEPFEKYNLSGVVCSEDDINTLIDMVYKNNVNEVNTNYQYITIPDISLQFHNQTYEMKSIQDVDKLKSEIKMEDAATYNTYIYYDENTGLIYKIEILCSNS